jgi:hypothetical protein
MLVRASICVRIEVEGHGTPWHRRRRPRWTPSRNERKPKVSGSGRRVVRKVIDDRDN